MTDPSATTLLVIDDDPDVLRATSRILVQAGYQVITGVNAAEALELTRRHLPAILLLDVMLPDGNGVEVAKQLKSEPALASVCIILLSGSKTSSEDQAAGLDAGFADGYLARPFSKPEFLARIDAMLRLRSMIAELAQSNTELKLLNIKLEQSQAQLLQSEKMAAVGQLAAGVAHEINNPIAFVNSNLNNLKDYVQQLLVLIDAYARCADASGMPMDAALRAAHENADLPFLRDDVVALLAESRDGLERVKKIVQDLRDFSRIDSVEWQEADLNAGLESTLNVARNELKYKSEVIKKYGELPPVRCHLGQINQVFLNLLVNAAQAIEDRGKITLSSGVDDPWVWVSIEDTGKGMAPEVLKRIFEPFFTTKPVGKGTGLGLSLAYDIVRNHSGRIDVSSQPGQGTCFKVWLPVAGPENPAA